MKKIIVSLIILMTAVVCVNARGVCNGTGCRVVGYSSYAHSGGFSHDRTCRVVDGYYGGCDNNYSGSFIQINAGMVVSPEAGFAGSIGFGQKFASGMTVGVRLSGKYANSAPGASVGLTTSYEFTALRKYTNIFYPVIGFEAGFGGMRADEEKHWDFFPYVGYKAGFNFEAVPRKLDVGVEYSGNYNFAIESLASHSSSFLEHSVAIVTRVYL